MGHISFAGFTSLVFAAVVAVGTPPLRADVASDFASNPLTEPGVLLQGPDASNAASRFSYDSAAQTLTAHYNTAAPTIKLLFPLGGHLTQNSSFNITTTFEILSSGFQAPPDFGAQAPAFGLVNSSLTGDQRASTADQNYNIVTDGTAYDALTFDYYPTQTADSSSVDLSMIQSPQAGEAFDDRFVFNNSLFANESLPLDQRISATIQYDAATGHALVNWGTGSLDADLTGADFDVDSFAITLWNDPSDNPTDGSFGWDDHETVAEDVVFDSFSVQAVPEPMSVALLGLPALLLLARRRR